MLVKMPRFEQNSRNTQKCDASVEIRTAHPNLLLPNELLPFWAAAPKEPMTYAFTNRGNFSFFSSVHPLQSSYPGLNPSLEAQILVLKPKF